MSRLLNTDPNRDEFYKAEGESIAEKAVRAQLANIKPKKGCKKCGGTGDVGVDFKTQKPILCRCVTKQIDKLIVIRNAMVIREN